MHALGEYYMSFAEKAVYAGHHDANGIPMLNYRGVIGLQYNPIAIAQWGLGNYNLFVRTGNGEARSKLLRASDWLCDHLEQNASGVHVWSHYFDWEYRQTLKAPWYSGLAQGQGISLFVRAHVENGAASQSQCFLPRSDGGIAHSAVGRSLLAAVAAKDSLVVHCHRWTDYQWRSDRHLR